MKIADLFNVLSYRSSDKICVFLVDDYGHLGMSGELTEKEINACPGILPGDVFNRYDGLESPDDLHSLFDALTDYKGSDNKPVVFTPVVCTGNPTFSDEENDMYSWESFNSSLKRSYGKEILDLWQQGENEGVFQPELHGREHIHPRILINKLKEQAPAFTWMRDHRSIAVLNDGNVHLRPFKWMESQDEEWQQKMLGDAVGIFESFFKRKPALFVPPGLIHGKHTEQLAGEYGILYMDSARSAMRSNENGQMKREIAWTGKRSNEIRYLCRNAMFEPATFGENSITQTLQAAEKAFRWRVPLVISSHRVNFAGGRDESNRARGLLFLRKLLEILTRRYPDMRFISASELISLMTI